MAKYAIFVVGPAGSGKSTLTTGLEQHLRLMGRPVHAINLDPASEHFEYKPSVDIRALISSDEAMEELRLGPNGALVFSLQFLLEQWEWFANEVGDYAEDYLLVDCPGQVEVYTHLPVMADVVARFVADGYRCCSLYCTDATLVNDAGGYISATLSALSTMFSLGLPHVSVLTKCDLLSETQRDRIDVFCSPGTEALAAVVESAHGRMLPVAPGAGAAAARPRGALARMNDVQMALLRLVEDESMIRFIPLDLTDAENGTIDNVVEAIDTCTGYGEDEETRAVDIDMPEAECDLEGLDEN